MGGYFIQNGGALQGTMGGLCLAEHDSLPERSHLSSPRYDWNYQLRSPLHARHQNNFWNRWTKPGFVDNGSGIAPILGMGVDDGTYVQVWDEWSWGESGTIRPMYIYGNITNNVGAVVPGTYVESFITSTNVIDGYCYSDSQGNYQVPCYTPSVAHYVVAYFSGPPDYAGVSANNLIPSS